MAYKMKGFSGFSSPVKKRGPKEIVEEHTSRVSKKTIKVKDKKIKTKKQSTPKDSTIKISTEGTKAKKTTPPSKKTSFTTPPKIDQTYVQTPTGTTRSRFETAFASARSTGEKTFKFEGKTYSTKVK